MKATIVDDLGPWSPVEGNTSIARITGNSQLENETFLQFAA